MSRHFETAFSPLAGASAPSRGREVAARFEGGAADSLERARPWRFQGIEWRDRWSERGFFFGWTSDVARGSSTAFFQPTRRWNASVIQSVGLRSLGRAAVGLPARVLADGAEVRCGSPHTSADARELVGILYTSREAAYRAFVQPYE